jgi:hypothetical protein
MRKLATIVSVALFTISGASASATEQIDVPTWSAMQVAHRNTIQLYGMTNSCNMWNTDREEFIQEISTGIHAQPEYNFYGERITIQRYMDAIC